LNLKTGNRVSALRAGQRYAGLKGVEHNVVNASDHEVVFVDIDIEIV